MDNFNQESGGGLPEPDNKSESDSTESQSNENDLPELTPEERLHPLISPIAAGFIGLFGGFFLYQVVGGVLTVLILGIKLEDAPANSVRLMTVAGQILFLLLPALIFAKLFYKDVGLIIRAKMPDIREIALFLLGIIFLTLLLESYLNLQDYLINKWAAISPLVKQIKSAFDSLDDLVNKTYGSLMVGENFAEKILIVIVIAVTPALCEEVLFRGFIQKSFELKMRPFWAALITAIFFGVYHLNPYGTIALIGLGLYFGFAAYMSNSIVVPIILHFFNNFLAVMSFFIIGNEDLIKSSSGDKINIGDAVSNFALWLILFSTTIIFIRRYYLKPKRI